MIIKIELESVFVKTSEFLVHVYLLINEAHFKLKPDIGSNFCSKILLLYPLFFLQ